MSQFRISLVILISSGLSLLILIPGVQGQHCASSYVHSSYTPSYHYEHKKVVPVVKQEVIFQKFIAVIPLAEFPTYSAVYAPPVALPQVAVPSGHTAGVPGGNMYGVPQHQQPMVSQQTQSEMKQILDMLKGMDNRLKVLETKSGGLVPGSSPNVQPPKAEQLPKGSETTGNVDVGVLAQLVLANKCAGCHVSGKEDKGGGFVLLGKEVLVANPDGTQGRAYERAALSGEQMKKFVRLLREGKMPPRNNKEGISPLTDEEAGLLVADLPNYPSAVTVTP